MGGLGLVRVVWAMVMLSAVSPAAVTLPLAVPMLQVEAAWATAMRVRGLHCSAGRRGGHGRARLRGWLGWG
jgi:cbb3-type cytochrome oxidase subunit 1